MNSTLLSAIFLAALPAVGSAQDTKPHLLTPVPIQQIVIDDEFWSPKRKVWRQVTIPDCFAKFEKDGALANFDKIRDGSGGEHGGPPWYDGLIYEMIRGCADFLASERDAVLEARLDGYIERIAAAAARDPDGYLNTYTQLKEPTHRWGLNGGNDNWQHDVYNAGAMVEAAVHYCRATGKTQLLQVAAKLANHMADVMGPPPKNNVVPGHSLGEEALVKLYLLFREKPALKSRMPVPVEEQRYLGLAEFWIENRGHHQGRQSYGPYGQDHQPVLQQETLEGHAVRATLLCAGLVATAHVNGREDYLQAARRLWDNMVQRRMYVIGGLGAVAGHEGFGPDYVLPNNGYLETCAAIGAGFFHYNLSLAFADTRYADELERVLYNAVLPGVSLQGNTYFYENPLQADQKRTRWSWHGCPCCPPMFLKIMGALPGYIYAQDKDTLYVNLFVGSRAALTVKDTQVTLRQTTRYPWDGGVMLAIEPERETEFALNLRLPGWCEEPRLQINGKPLATFRKVRGYAHLPRKWQRGDVVELSLPMPVERVKAHPKVEADTGRVALQRGPLVYCLEAVDNGGQVRNLLIPPEAKLSANHRADLLGGITVIQGNAFALQRVAWPDALYLPLGSVPGVTPLEFTAIPYFANANRQPGDMMVWLAETAAKADPSPPPAPVDGPFQPDWASLKAHQDPDWFRDAKFGIYTHWGPVTVGCEDAPRGGEWYGMEMYQTNSPIFAYHKQKFGDQRTFGYKDVVPLFKAPKFDPDKWADLFVRAGARFAGPVAVHHDNFALWDSAVTPWNSLKTGPKRDITGELAKAYRARGLRFLTTFHHGFAWRYFEPSFEFDAADGKNFLLYTELHGPKDPPSRRFQDQWLAMVMEVVQQYEPDLLWFDFELRQVITPEYQQRMFADYYNWAAAHGKESAVAHKFREIHTHTGILDFERGREDKLVPYPWLTDTALGPWFNRNADPYRTTENLVHVLADIVSKNGCLLLNVGPNADGSIPDRAEKMLLEIGDWLKVNGEAIYGTRPWQVYGEGPTRSRGGGGFSEGGDKRFTPQDIRFTTKGDTLYAIALGWPTTGKLLVKSLARPAGKVTALALLGSDAVLDWAQTDSGLEVTLPARKPCDHAYTLKIDGTPLR